MRVEFQTDEEVRVDEVLQKFLERSVPLTRDKVVVRCARVVAKVHFGELLPFPLE